MDLISQGNGMESVLDAKRSAQANRVSYAYDVPAGLAKKTGISKVMLVELTAEEELMATKRARNDMVRLASELAKEALRMVDGKRLSSGDGSVDQVWNLMHPQVRQLVMGAYGNIHAASSNDEQYFLESCQVNVGG